MAEVCAAGAAVRVPVGPLPSSHPLIGPHDGAPVDKRQAPTAGISFNGGDDTRIIEKLLETTRFYSDRAIDIRCPFVDIVGMETFALVCTTFVSRMRDMRAAMHLPRGAS